MSPPNTIGASLRYYFRRTVVGAASLCSQILAVPADAIFARPLQPPGLVWLRLCVTLQIYWFSGTRTWQSAARMFGIRFLENFSYPYISPPITEFWRRAPLSVVSGPSWRHNRCIRLVTSIWSPCFCYAAYGTAAGHLCFELFHGALVGALVEKCFRLCRCSCSIYAALTVMVGWVFPRCAGQAISCKLMVGLRANR